MVAPVATDTGGTSGGGSTAFINDRALVGIGILAGFVVVPVLARAAPEAVNGLLLLILFGALLINQNRWLPWLTRLSSASRK